MDQEQAAQMLSIEQEFQEMQERYRQSIYRQICIKYQEDLNLLLGDANSNVINNLQRREELMLELAVKKGDAPAVNIILAHGIIPNSDYSWSDSTLSSAIISSDSCIIKLLINHGCDPDINFKIVRLCGQQAVDDDITHPKNCWDLIIEINNVSIFQLLLESKNREIGNDELSHKMLFTACKLGSDAIVEYLLDQGVPIESTDENNWTCVFYAVDLNKISTLHLLISRGANLKHKDSMGRTLLHVSVLHNKLAYRNVRDLVQLFIDHGIDINATDNRCLTPINLAFTNYNKNREAILLLLSQPNIDLSIPNQDGITVSHRLVYVQDHAELRSLLCRLDIDVNARDRFGRTPLQMIHIPLGGLYSLGPLLEFGADTEVLFLLRKDILNDRSFQETLESYRLKRSIAGISKDQNIETLLAQHCVFSIQERVKLVEEYSKEIELMRETILCDKLTYYDFLHAKKRTCINVAKIPEMREIFIGLNHNFKYYANMLTKNYLSGIRPLTLTEAKAINSAKENLDVIFNNKLPSTIVYDINKYIDIEDMVTLNNMIIIDSSDNKKEKV